MAIYISLLVYLTLHLAIKGPDVSLLLWLTSFGAVLIKLSLFVFRVIRQKAGQIRGLKMAMIELK